MNLKIICPKITSELQTIVDKLCKSLKIKDYELMDTISYELKPGPVAILLGDCKVTVTYHNKWTCALPSMQMSNEEKNKVFGVFKQAAEFLVTKTDPTTVRKQDLPEPAKVKELDQWLKENIGTPLDIILKDNRVIRVYPDDYKFENKADIEIHYSTLKNLDILFHLLDAQELIVRN